MVSSSFRRCGICLAVDGSKDELIHCFKEGRRCHDGAERWRVLASSIDENQENPFKNVTEPDVDEVAKVQALLESDETWSRTVEKILENFFHSLVLESFVKIET